MSDWGDLSVDDGVVEEIREAAKAERRKSTALSGSVGSEKLFVSTTGRLLNDWEAEVRVLSPQGDVRMQAIADVDDWSLEDVKAELEKHTGTLRHQQRLLMNDTTGFPHHLAGMLHEETLRVLLPPGTKTIDIDMVGTSIEQSQWLFRAGAYPHSLQHAPENILGDFEVLRSAVQTDGAALQYANTELRNNRLLVAEALKQSGSALLFASPALRADRDLVTEAVLSHGAAIACAAPELLADRAFLVELLGRNPGVMVALPEAVRGDRAFVLRAVRRCGEALYGVADALREDPEVVLQAVRQDGLALEFALGGLAEDREVVHEALRNNGLALAFAAPELQGDEATVLVAVQQNGLALAHATKALRRNEDVVFAALRPGPEAAGAEALELASEVLRDDPDFVQRCVLRNACAMRFATARLRKNCAYVRLALQGKYWEPDEDSAIGQDG